MGSNKLKVALVGLGKMGMLHLSILATMAEVEVVAIIDNNQKAIKTIWSMGYKVKSYKTLDEAMAVEKIEAVWVLTPNWTHKEIVKKAINNGIAVLVEKPATINEKDLEEYRRWLSKKVAVGYVLLYSRGFYRLKELIDSGKYGKVKSFRGEYLVEEVLEPKKGWMYEKKKSGGGVMINPGPHIFSLASWLFNGLKVESVELRRIKSVEVEDSADIGLKTGGVIGRIILNWSVKGKIRPEIKLEIETDKARLTSDGRMVEIKNKQGIKLIRETEIDQIYEQAFNINRESFGEAYFNEDKDFVRWVRGEQAGVRNDLSLALKTEGLINEAYKLAKNG